jgi:hypothetical protein
LGLSTAVATLLIGNSTLGYAAPGPWHQEGRCAHESHGIIGAKWHGTGGVTGPLGCPVADEEVPHFTPPGFPADMAERNRQHSRRQRFDHGEIVWSPAQGDAMTVAVWAYGEGGMHIEWGSTNPFHYDRFIVSVDGNQTDINSGGRDGYNDRIERVPGPHRIVVEGCDGNSTCRQGWTVPAEFYASGVPQPPAPNPAPPPMPKLPPPSTPAQPHIDVASNGEGFKVSGHGFLPGKPVHVRATDDQLHQQWFELSADVNGGFTLDTGKICTRSGPVYFAANDGRNSKTDLTGTLWSNTANGDCGNP